MQERRIWKQNAIATKNHMNDFFSPSCNENALAACCLCIENACIH